MKHTFATSKISELVNGMRLNIKVQTDTGVVEPYDGWDGPYTEPIDGSHVNNIPVYELTVTATDTDSDGDMDHLAFEGQNGGVELDDWLKEYPPNSYGHLLTPLSTFVTPYWQPTITIW